MIIIFILNISCNENLDLTQNDLKKYPWLMPFINLEIQDLKGTHNVDNGKMNFNFRTSKSSNLFYLEIDEFSKKNDWHIEEKSVLSRTYSKLLSPYPADTILIKIKMRLDTNTNRIYYKID